jgi:hypothetical protein
MPLEKLPNPNVHAFARFRDAMYVGTEGGTAVYAWPPDGC